MLPGKTYAPSDALRLMRRHGWIVVTSLLTGAFTALIVSALLPNMYRSEMLVQIVPQRVPDSYVQSTVTMRTEDRLDSLSQQVMSRTQLERLIQEFDLYQAERAELPLEDVVDLMRSDIGRELVRPTRDEPADAFYLRFTYRDARIATAVTARLGSLFIDRNAAEREDLAEATNEFLAVQLKEARSLLESQERKLEEFRQRHAGRLPSQLDFNMQAIQNTQLQVQALVESLARDRDRKLLLERIYADASAEPLPVPPPLPSPTTNAPSDPSSPVAPMTARQQLDAARSALEKASLRLTPEHPDIVRLKRLIEELEKRVKAEPEKPALASTPASRAESPQEAQRRERLRQMRAEIESLDRQIAFKESEEARLRAAVGEYQSRIAAVPALESEWTALTRDYDTLKAAYQKLLAKSEESKVAADLERRQIGEQFRILDPARVPIRPISPNRPKINGIGVALGLLVGLALLALIELRDASFRTESELASVLSLPVLALIPVVETADDLKARRRRRLMASVAGIVVVSGAAYVFWAMKLWRYVA
jgi:polysaccharide chain length determinant protein (PEP-CTERM system associated)